MSALTTFVRCTSLAILLSTFSPVTAAPFLKAKSKTDRCDALQSWINNIGRTGDLDNAVQKKVADTAAPIFVDSVFRPAIGKAFSELSGKERKAIADGLKSCFKQSWIRGFLTEPFSDDISMSSRENWNLAIIVARSLSQRPRPKLREVEIRELGLKVMAPEWMAVDDKVTPPSRVSGVRVGGPAFEASIRPGDALLTIGEQNWPANPGTVFEEAMMGRRNTLTFMVQNPRGVSKVEVKIGQAQPGTWLTDPSIDVLLTADRPPPPPQDPVRAEALQRLNDIRSAARERARKSACNWSNTDTRAVMAEADPWAKRAGVSTVLLDTDLRNAAKNGCSDQRFGPLPDLETILVLIAEGKLDPCAYSRQGDYSKLIEERRATYSVEAYGVGADSAFRFYTDRAQPAQRKCFFDILESALRR